ncbi:hypothetical protein ACFQHO_11800 [Actinomadura yumaensis]|uniref:methyltransferase family protein n=1 Tax=Actinomadura yumaensis TaxID=111807 RepID=UPI00361E7DE8
MPEPSQDPVSAQVDRLAIGAALVQAVHAAARFGVADELAAGPRPVEELAAAVGADGPALYRLMRALAAAEVFEELDGRRFALAPLGALLREGAPGSIRDWALAVGSPSTGTPGRGCPTASAQVSPRSRRCTGGPCSSTSATIPRRRGRSTR